MIEKQRERGKNMETTSRKPTEEKLKPKLFSVMKNYSASQFIKDLVAGVIVAIIALPLSIALALAAGAAKPTCSRLANGAGVDGSAAIFSTRRLEKPWKLLLEPLDWFIID